MPEKTIINIQMNPLEFLTHLGKILSFTPVCGEKFKFTVFVH